MYAIVIDVSPSSWIQAFSICLHESAPLPSDSWLCLVLHITHCCISMKCTRSLLQHRDAERCTGRAVRWEYAAPFSSEGSASDAWLWQLTILTRAFHPLSDHTTGDHMASHLWRPTSTSLYIKANTTCFQQKYSCLHGGAAVPEEWKMQQQQILNK